MSTRSLHNGDKTPVHTWTSISTKLVESPDDLKLWEQLVEAAELNNNQGITKASSPEELELLRVSYIKFLDKYPLLFNYWIKFAEWEFKLGNTERAIQIYEDSLHHLSYSIEIWIHYLKFKLMTINDNLFEILELFERARKFIGYHFHAYEFYKLYLKFLESYGTETNEFKKKYYILLRIIVEIPLYHYEYFFKLYFDIIASLSNEKSSELSTYLVSSKDLKSLTQGTDNKSISVYLKKIFIDVYITTQFKVYELYTFEMKLTKQYFDYKPISIQQLDSWVQYLDFLQLRDYPSEYVKFVYNRCLLSTALYPKIWIKLANYHIYRKEYEDAETVLLRSLSYSSDHNLILKLVDINLYNQEILRARDLIVGFIQNCVSVPIPIYEKLLNIERLLHTNDNDYIVSIFKEVIKNTNRNSWIFHHLSYYSLPNEYKRKILEEFPSTDRHRVQSIESLANIETKPDYDEEISSYL
ncbi:uncharacterized protein RJT21DRAFT_117474 [Scheffersomyces amazonensis]|uniref:uncharacterized protein n=1 Tax=Scheffersomyces amazonensis TaxID=1078765 RepID=UPI00315CBB43